MSFYKKLEVADKIYEYHIGKSFVKIKGIPGNNNLHKDEVGLAGKVTPSMIKKYILGKERKPEDHFETCNCDASKFLKPKSQVNLNKNVSQTIKIYAYLCANCFKKNSIRQVA